MTTFYALKRKTTGTMEPMLYKRIKAAQAKADKHGLYEVVPLSAAAEACVPVAETAGEAVPWEVKPAPNDDPDWPEAERMDSKVWRVKCPDGHWRGVLGVDEEDARECAKQNYPDRHWPIKNPVPAQDDDKLRIAVEAIAAERQRQVEVEGWSESHDDEHDDYQMARAAACYALNAGKDRTDEGFFDSVSNAAIHHSWPWDRSWWKPKDRRSDLVRAGALIVAEIQRLDRAALKSTAAQEGGEV